MNTVQWVTAIRVVVLFVSGMGFAQAIIPKWLLESLQDEALLTGLVTGVAAIAAAVYAVLSRRKTAMLQAVAELPDVKAVEVVSPQLAGKVPSDKVVAR